MRIYIKRGIISLIICILGCSTYAVTNIPQGIKPLPSETYANRLNVCGAHKESIFYNIPLKPLGIRSAHFKEILNIIGIRNGKCAIQSKIILKDINEVISTTECKLTEQQRKTLANKIKTASSSVQKKNEFINYYNYLTTKSPNTCIIKNYLDE